MHISYYFVIVCNMQHLNRFSNIKNIDHSYKDSTTYLILPNVPPRPLIRTPPCLLGTQE